MSLYFLYSYKTKYINFILYIILFNIITITKEKYITIPFKILHKDEQIFTNFDDYYNSLHDMIFHGEISVGTPPQKIITILNCEDYGISILNKGCIYNISSEDINIELNLENSSSSFNQTYDIFYGDDKFYYKTFLGSFFAKDTFYFKSIDYKGESSDIIKIENISFIYSPYDNKKICTCLNIGLTANCINLHEKFLNIIYQLKKYSIIDSYDWSIIFDNNKKDPDKGLFLLGAKPHEYNPELFNENDLFNSGFISEVDIKYFNFKINEIYFESYNTSEKIIINDLDQIQLIPTYGLIKASKKYEENIEIYFFNYFINNNKCFKEYRNINDKEGYRTFVCYNEPNIKEELRKKFPVLKLKHKGFVYTFELNYDDLFKENGDKIYFLIWFAPHIMESGWEMGYPFTKKYLFSYNYDNKMVYFYNKIENKEETKKTSNKYLIINIVIIIGLIIIASAIGFVIGMFFKNKKKSIAQELESENSASLFEENEINK